MFDKLANTISSIIKTFSKKGTIQETDVSDGISKIQDALIDADVPLSVAREFIHSIKSNLIGKQIPKYENPSNYLLVQFKNTIVQFLSASQKTFQVSFPETILIIGLQGSGKTTTIAKLAHKIKQEYPKKTILLSSVDYYRPAAIEQLEIGAKNAGVSFYRSSKPDVINAIHDIMLYRKTNKFDVLLLDTAGRMHIDSTMIEELRHVKNLVKPTQTIIVLDAMLGQESMHVAQEFQKEIDFDSAILSKMDSDTRGGVAFAFSYIVKKPIFFMGTGEKMRDLSPFHADRIANKIVGKGDLETLIEEAERKTKELSIDLQTKPDSFTLNDFANHIKTMHGMGSFGKLLSYMPTGMLPKISNEQITQMDSDLKKSLAIINSMTKKERIKISLLNPSRKQRVAKGAGVSDQDVEMLMKRYKEMRDVMKMFKKF